MVENRENFNILNLFQEDVCNTSVPDINPDMVIKDIWYYKVKAADFIGIVPFRY